MQKIDYQKAQLSKLQPQLELAQVHEDDFKAQRDEYQRQMENPEPNQAIITLDFKENWRVGLGPEQTGRDFYRQQQVSQLGVVIVTLVNGKPQKNVLNIFSKILSHDARVTRDCLDIIMKQDILKDITDIQFWSDCGPHFRCREYLYHALFALPDKHRDLKVTVNLMAEYHGKNEVDALFGTLTTWYSQACKTAPINSLDELMGVFKLKLDAAQKANEKAAMEASNSNSNSNSNSTTKKAATELAYDAEHVKQIVYERNDRLPGATTYHTVNFKGFRRYLKFTRPAGQPMEGIYPISADPYQDPDPASASVSASASAPVGRGRPRKNKVVLLLCVYYRSNTATGIDIRATKETVQDDRQDKRAPQRVTQGHPRQVDGDDDGYDGADTAVPFSSQHQVHAAVHNQDVPRPVVMPALSRWSMREEEAR
ncbi:hypothetical protein GQ42DRAFT_50103 [Ramicandelaber brevisporus]|nr:hypothetical protein GQ42DRAFT_50103 [Ramicandelaber brevisporus]